MKLWIDDVRPAPNGYHWCKSVNEAKRFIEYTERESDYFTYLNNKAFLGKNYSRRNSCSRLAGRRNIDIIDIDHDAGIYAFDGGDYIKLLDWLEETHRNYPIHIHSMNPVGVQNMRAIIQHNHWQEV